MVWPIFQSMYPEPFAHFAALCVNAGTLRNYQFHVGVKERTLLYDAMNQIVASVLSSPNIKAVIVFDDDCRPPVDAIARLLKHYEDGKEFVAGMGFMRNYPHSTTIGRFYPEGLSLTLEEGPDQGKMKGFQWLDDVSRLSGTVEVDFCGFPIAMMSRSLLERMGDPWFQTRDEDGGACTHDVYFCRKAKSVGGKIWVDTTIKCDHLVAAPWVTFENRGQVRDAIKRALALAEGQKNGVTGNHPVQSAEDPSVRGAR